MAITVNHSTPADGSFSASGATAWNANHTLVGLGTMAEQDANNVNITGGTISGVTGVGTVTSVAASAGTGISITGSPITSSGTLNITNTAPDQTVSLTNGTGISVTGTYPNFTITNTSPSSGGTVTSVTATAPVASTGGTTPVISMPVATSSVNGYLSSTDWTTFNNKQPAGSYLTSVIADSPLTGAGTSASHLSIPAATTSVNGYLTSTDWTTFNNKQDLLISGTNIKTINGSSVLGSGNLSISTSAGGATTQVQYNNSGAFAGNANFTYTGNDVNVPFGPSNSATSVANIALFLSLIN